MKSIITVDGITLDFCLVLCASLEEVAEEPEAADEDNKGSKIVWNGKVKKQDGLVDGSDPLFG